MTSSRSDQSQQRADNEDHTSYAKCVISALEVRIKDDPRANKQSNQASEDNIKKIRQLNDMVKSHSVDFRLRNQNDDTALILAAKSNDLELVRHFAEYAENADSCRSQAELLCETNRQKENALMCAVQVSPCNLDNANDEGDSVFTYLLQLAVRLRDKDKSLFGQKTSKRQNLLHLAFSRVCQSHNDFCIAKHLLQVLKENNISVDVQLEDRSHLTPLFHLIRSSSQPEPNTEIIPLELIRALKDYCNGENKEINKGCKKIPFESLLVNSQGMDIAHVCAYCNRIKDRNDLFDKLKLECSTERHTIELYRNRQAEFASQIIIGGPISGRDGKQRSPRQRPFKYRQWTAMHFACSGGHVESIKFLMGEGFSLQDTTQDGRTCTDLAFDNPDQSGAILQAFQEFGSKNKNKGPHGEHWVLEYVACVDSTRCALDSCDGDCSSHEETLTETEADKKLEKAWRLFKKRDRFKEASEKSLSDINVKSLMYMCFENDSATQYRTLLHSSYWKQINKDQQQQQQKVTAPGAEAKKFPAVHCCHTNEDPDEDKAGSRSSIKKLPIETDQAFIEYFLKVRGEMQQSEDPEVPLKERFQIVLDFIQWTSDKLVMTQNQASGKPYKHMFSYQDNGKIFLRKLGKPDDYFKVLSLIDLAIVTGRPSMAKALIVTRQFDLIPMSISAIIRCNELINQEQLINYYPIRDINVNLKSVKAFAAKVALNAIDFLFRGCKDSEADLIFEFLLGKMDTCDREGNEGQLPHSKLMIKNIKWGHGCRREPTTTKKEFSTLELIRKSAKDDLYGAECIQQLVQKMWREPPEYSSSHYNDVCQTSPALKSSIAAEQAETSGSDANNRAGKESLVGATCRCGSNSEAAAKGKKVETSAGNRTSDQDEDQTSATCCPSAKYLNEQISRYFRCPRRSLVLYGVSTFVYIIMLIICLTNPSVRWNWSEVILMLFLLAFVIQEIHECYIRVTTVGEGFTSYLFDMWNIYDLLNIIFLLAGFIVKASTGANRWGDMDDADATKLAEVSVKNHYYYKVLMSVSLLLASAKFLKTLRYSRPIGLNVVIMPHIFYRDLLPFVIILALMIISFGVVMMSLLTVGRYSFNGSTAIRRRNDITLFEIYTRPLLSAFGEFQLDSIDACDSSVSDGYIIDEGCYFDYAKKVHVRLILLAFLLIVNLVMFNMLIAKFSCTVSRFEKRSPLIWLAMRHELLIDYCRLSSWPPPLNILGSLSKLHAFCREKCCRCSNKVCNEDLAKKAKKDREELTKAHEKFLIRQAAQFRGRRHEMATRKVETIEDDIEEELMGENDVNSEWAELKFDVFRGPPPGDSTNSIQRKLVRLVRLAKSSNKDGPIGDRTSTRPEFEGTNTAEWAGSENAFEN